MLIMPTGFPLTRNGQQPTTLLGEMPTRVMMPLITLRTRNTELPVLPLGKGPTLIKSRPRRNAVVQGKLTPKEPIPQTTGGRGLHTMAISVSTVGWRSIRHPKAG